MTPNDALYALLLVSALVGAACAAALIQHARDRFSPESQSRVPKLWGYLAYFVASVVGAGVAKHFGWIYDSILVWAAFWTAAWMNAIYAVTLLMRAVRNARERSRSMRRYYVRAGLWLLPILLLFTGGCTSPTDIFADLKDDHAAVQMTVVTPWGTQHFTRVNPATGQSATISGDGTMTITAK